MKSLTAIYYFNVALLLLGLATTSQAALIVDDFQTFASATAIGAASTDSDGPHSGSGILGTRNITVNNVGGPASATSLIIAGGVAAADTGTTTTNADILLNYTFTAQPISSSDGLSINIATYNAGTGANPTLTITMEDSGIGTSSSTPLSFNSTGSLFIPLTSLVGSLNFSLVDLIQVRFDSEAGTDFTLQGPIVITNNVPEPAPIALWSLFGLAAAAFAWHRRKR